VSGLPSAPEDKSRQFLWTSTNNLTQEDIMTMATRRQILGAAVAGSAAAALAPLSASQPAQAAVPMSGHQAPGFYRFKMGDIEVTTVHDGARTFPYPDTFVKNASREEALAAASDAFMPPGMVTVPFNPTLINTGSKLVLIDTGFGPIPNAPVGQLIANLKAAGIDPKDIDIVILSHLHPDHINGVRAPDGSIVFPNAELKAPAKEWAFWMSDENMAKAQDNKMMKDYFANTRKVLGDLDSKVTKYDWDKEVAPGITSIAAPGHTPGHTAFAVTSGNKGFFVQSDVTNIPEFFLRNPDWHVAYDIDPEQAAKTRHKFYDMAASEKMLISGFHFSFPSVGHVEKDGTKYRLIPIAWSSAT
jgi:glyoxylase-like metal-dependent hydrolase (beta-lactamase superfamily II)